MKPPLPANELERQRGLEAHEILDTPPERHFDDIVQLAAIICGTPVAVMTLIDGQRQWFKAKVGLSGSETSRDVSFCAHAILDPKNLLIVPDATQDARFSDNPFVVDDPKIRFYAGSPLVDIEGHALGGLCVADFKPRELKPEQSQALRILSRYLTMQMDLNLHLRRMARFQKLSVGRELDMVRMKSEVNTLLAELGRPPRYRDQSEAA